MAKYCAEYINKFQPNMQVHTKFANAEQNRRIKIQTDELLVEQVESVHTPGQFHILLFFLFTMMCDSDVWVVVCQPFVKRIYDDDDDDIVTWKFIP